MATQVQASVAHKAATTTSATTGANLTAAKSSNGVHTHSSSAGVAAIAAASTTSLKTSSSATATVQNSSTTSLSSSIGIHTSSYDRESITLTEEQKRILKLGTCSMGDALSQVPWMKFRVIAEPNMDIFASDIRLRTFIREVTELTVSIVTKQCQEEVAILVATLIASLTSSMEVRIKLIVETIIEQIATLCLEDSMTTCHNLHEIKEKVCFPKHCEPHHGSHDDYDGHRHSHDSKHAHDGKHSHDGYGDSDKHKHGYGDSKHSHDSYGDSDKHGKHHTPETPKKYTGKATPVPGAKSTS